MIITNNENLPAPIYNLCGEENYKPAANEYRVTSILKGTKEAVLEKRHWDEIERDCSDMAWLLWGTLAHKVLELQQEGKSQIKEARLSEEIQGHILSGQFDLYDAEEKTLTDYKTCSVWKVIYGDYADWRRQTLIYCWLLKKAGFEVEKAQVVAMMRDHQISKAKFDKHYPKYPFKKITFEFDDNDLLEIERFIEAKLADISEAEHLPDDAIVPCTPKERWTSETKYAVMQRGKKKALRLLTSENEAYAWMRYNGGDYVETRKGEDKKCKDYCAVCEFCSYYRQHVQEYEGGYVKWHK